MQASFYLNKIKEVQEQGDMDALSTAARQARGFVAYAEEHAKGRELLEVLMSIYDEANKAAPLNPKVENVQALTDLRERMDQQYREAA